jgi:hypothetical protein
MEARNRNREKFINAMIFFALNTNRNKIGKLKMSKLLFALDFEHFKQTGRWVTGMRYYAYPKGPYPKDEFEKVSDKAAPPDIDRVMGVTPMYEDDLGESRGYLFKVRGNHKPDLSLFSKRELEIMKWLAECWHDATGKQIKDWSHKRGTPWRKVWEEENRKYEPISYAYAIDDSSPLTKEDAEALLKEEEEFSSIFPTRRA